MPLFSRLLVTGLVFLRLSVAAVDTLVCVIEVRDNPLDNCGLSVPAIHEIRLGDSLWVTAGVREWPGTTESGAYSAISAWIGFNERNVSPGDSGWKWIQATYLEDEEGWDLYTLNIGRELSRVDTFYYISRFCLPDSVFHYGGWSLAGGGFWDGIDYLSGRVVVEDTSTAIAPRIGLPTRFRLYPAYPNPFNPVTIIRLDLPEEDFCMLRVFDIRGHQIAILEQNILPPGAYRYTVNGHGWPSGVYLIRAETRRQTQTIKAILLK